MKLNFKDFSKFYIEDTKNYRIIFSDNNKLYMVQFKTEQDLHNTIQHCYSGPMDIGLGEKSLLELLSSSEMGDIEVKHLMEVDMDYSEFEIKNHKDRINQSLTETEVAREKFIKDYKESSGWNELVDWDAVHEFAAKKFKT
jgi:hypothetical protein